MNKFRCYELAKSLYQQCKRQPVKGAVRDQLHRASLSVCLNLVEGSAVTGSLNQGPGNGILIRELIPKPQTLNPKP